jgi:hypothetical protein
MMVSLTILKNVRQVTTATLEPLKLLKMAYNVQWVITALQELSYQLLVLMENILNLVLNQKTTVKIASLVSTAFATLNLLL